MPFSGIENVTPPTALLNLKRGKVTLILLSHGKVRLLLQDKASFMFRINGAFAGVKASVVLVMLVH